MAADGAGFMPILPTIRTRAFLGVRFTPMAMETACAAIVAQSERLERFVYVATPNVDHVVKLRRDPGRGALYDGAWLRLNDSQILARLAKKSGIDLPVSPGSDVAAYLFTRVIGRHEPVTVIGADEAAVEALKAATGLWDVRAFVPPMGLARNPQAIAEAAAFAARQRTRFTFLCVGAPQQEMIAWAIAMRGDAVGVGICCGAALDFVSGRARRAPAAMRKLGLEWAFRLACEPKRLWRRYLVEGPSVFQIWREETRAQEAPRRAAISARKAA